MKGEFNMIGIYKITNRVNGHSYIGQSTDIENRWKSHKKRAYCSTGKEYEKALYRAIRKYGLSNFKFEVLEEAPQERLNNLEIKYIELYDTYFHGYNETPGGDARDNIRDEQHPKTQLTNEEVFYIRECYKNHLMREDVFEQFKDKIGISGFRKIWNGYSWQDIHMDVYTTENKDFYKYIRNSKSSNNVPKEKILDIRRRAKQGESLNSIYQDYKEIPKQNFTNIYRNKTYQHIQP